MLLRGEKILSPRGFSIAGGGRPRCPASSDAFAQQTDWLTVFMSYILVTVVIVVNCVRFYFEGPCGSTLPQALAPHDSEATMTA